jgi:cytochrome c biogenesis protein ResB
MHLCKDYLLLGISLIQCLFDVSAERARTFYEQCKTKRRQSMKKMTPVTSGGLRSSPMEKAGTTTNMLTSVWQKRVCNDGKLT